MLPLRPARSTAARWLALALLCAAVPVSVHAQVARPPAPTTPTRVTRPPLDVGAITAEAAEQQLVTVPDLEGRTVAEARRLLASVGLEMGRVAEGTTGGAPGTIMQQQPRAGSSVAPRSDVRVWLVPQRQAAEQGSTLSRPPVTQQPQETTVTVPRLVGRTVEDARGMLAQVTLEVASVGELDVTGTPGTIVRQSPRAGSAVAPKSGVQLWIVPERVAQQQPQETPPAPAFVRVPSLVGRTVEDARTTLASLGLQVGPLAEAAGTGTPGTISRQQPAAGSVVVPSSRVRLWLVPARTAVMPAIMGLPLDRARALIQQAGLRPGEVGGTGRVIAHTFEAGASVPAGSVVNISLGVPPGSVGQVATRPDPPTPQPPATRPPPAGQVPPAAQTPAGQTPPVAAPPVAAPADSAGVPDVRRLGLQAARGALAAAGFTAAFDTALADSAGWTVSAQQPGPGARLASGGVVALLLDPPAPSATAGTTTPPPPVAGPAQPAPTQPAARQLPFERRTLWMGLAALLLVVAAAVGARRLRAGRGVPPVTSVSARLRMDTPARVAVEGMPFGTGRLRLRMNPGRTATRLSGAGALFVQKEVSGD